MVPVDEVRMLRGLKGEEDTAIIVTTGRFSADAQNEAKPGQNQRIVYLIDGDKLIEICKRNQIGVKMVPLPGLLVLDPEVAREAPVHDDPEAAEDGAEPDDLPERTGFAIRRLRDEMLGDPERGLSVEEVAELSCYKVNTVRIYLSDDRRKALGDAIRADPKARSRALAIVSSRREMEPPE
jgi:Restriction endonuclease